MAKTTQHTPGPWKVGRYDSERYEYIVAGPAEHVRHAGHGLARVSALWQKDGGMERTTANARMIAAAPEMFEMVLLLEKTIEYEIRVSNAKGDDEGARLKGFTLAQVRELIAKIEGQKASEAA